MSDDGRSDDGYELSVDIVLSEDMCDMAGEAVPLHPRMLPVLLLQISVRQRPHSSAGARRRGARCDKLSAVRFCADHQVYSQSEGLQLQVTGNIYLPYHPTHLHPHA